jgi:urease accessory protein
VSVAALLLSDARFPAGGHAHSGGLEAAATAGTVTGLASLEVFLRGRLRTAGLVAAGLAAAACARARMADDGEGGRGAPGDHGPAGLTRTWAGLDAEADARTPSPAQREASRRQGRALLRAARAAWPEAHWLAGLAAPSAARGVASAANAAEYRGGPHHAVVLGAAAAAAGCAPDEAARIAAYQSVSGPASAAVRLLALDPMRATAVLAGLAGEIDDTATRAAACAEGPPGDLPYPSAPALDLLAEAHIRAEVRLFES